MNKQLDGGAVQPLRGAVAVLAALVVVTGCGGGGGGDAAPSAASPDAGASSPVVSKADVRSAVLDRSTQPVRAVSTDIDDSGRVMVVYTQSVGGRLALQAVLAEPGPAGGAPVLGTPDTIDATAPHDGAIAEFSVTMSPRGHAVASWILTAACTADSYRTSGDCRYVVASRRLANQAWEPPVRVGDSPAPLPKAIINDTGDVAMTWTAGRRGSDGTTRSVQGVLVMPAAGNRFSAPVLFDDVVLPDNGYVGMTLDRSGNIVYVMEALADGRKQLVARRGSLVGGMGPTERLDSLDADVNIEGISGGLNGQVVVLWQQASGGTLHQFAAAVDTPGQVWQLADLGAINPGQHSLSTIGDDGDFLRYDLDRCTALARKRGVWQSGVALPAGLCQTSPSFASAIARTGDVVGGWFSDTAVSTNTGQWIAYSAQRQALTQAPGSQAADHLLGTPSTLGGQLLLAENGIAALVSIQAFDALPSAAAPAGTPGSTANLWLTYLRLP